MTTSDLSRRASLNTVAAGLDYGARLVVELLVTPVLVAGLGSYFYGAWRVLWQWTGYLWATSGRSAQALQSAISNRQTSPDVGQKRQYVASAVLVWLLFLPLLVGIGVVGVWIAPLFLHTSVPDHGTVRAAAAILVADAIVLTLLTVPRSVLQGENLGYKRMGLSAAVVLVGGILMALAAHVGAGIVGVATATIVTTILTSLTFFAVVRKHVPWFGVARPSRAVLRWFLGLSSWFLAWKLVFELMTASDVLLLAGLASVELVTVYVLTKFVADALSVLMLTVVQGVTPGLGGVIGSGDVRKAAQIRREVLALTWLLITVVGSTLIIWNASFVRLWVGEEHFAGPLASLLVTVMAVQFVLIRSDSYLVDVTLQIRVKVLLGAVSTLISIGCAAVLVGVFDLGIPGLCGGVIVGRSLLSLMYPWLVGRAIHESLPMQLRAAARPLVVTASFLGTAYAVGLRVRADSWMTLPPLVAATVAVLVPLALVCGLTGAQRRRLLDRFSRLLRTIR